MSTFIRATIIRAIRSFFQSLASNLPAGLVVTPVMLQTLDINILYVIAAYLATALLHSIASVVTSIATGLPEADYEEYINMDVEEPDDAEIFEDEDEEAELIMFDEDPDDTEVFEDEIED